MRKPKPNVRTTEGMLLKIIAIDVNASANETLDALIHWAYHLPMNNGVTFSRPIAEANEGAIAHD